MPTLSQSDRPLRVYPQNSNVPADTLLAEKFTGVEAISALYCFKLNVYSVSSVAFENVLGQGLTTFVQDPSGNSRYFDGIVRQIRQGSQVQAPAPAPAAGLYSYQIEVVPKVWLLTLNVQSRIFLGKSTREILQAVLTDPTNPVSNTLNVDFSGLKGKYPTRDHCVQYNESDFAFASRLMEEEGIFYFFSHDQGTHTMVLKDPPTFKPPPTFSSLGNLTYNDKISATVPLRLWAWQKVQQLRATTVTVRDYSFELADKTTTMDGVKTISPTVAVGKVTHQLSLTGVNQALAINQYPGGFAKLYDEISQTTGLAKTTWNDDITDMGTTKDRFSGNRALREAVESLQIEAGGDCALLIPGSTFNLQNHFNATFSDGTSYYLITQVTHAASVEGVYSGLTSTPAFAPYTNDIQCIPSGVPYQPAQQTPRPCIVGTHTATVVGLGTSDMECHCDKYGRVKVKFRWDRGDATSTSCWVRVSQVWAGQNYGAFFWPRPGHEVVVTFEDGDPDRPLITGSVYNNVNTVPMILPNDVLNSGFWSCNSTEDAKQRNKLVFEDSSDGVGLVILSDRAIYQSDNDPTKSVTGSPKTPTSNFGWTYGQDIDCRFGLSSGLVLGATVDCLVNPLGWLSQFGKLPLNPEMFAGGPLLAFATGVRDLLGGRCSLTFGSDTSANFGPKIDIHHGETFEGPSALHDKVAKIAIVALAAISAACSTVFVLSGALWRGTGDDTNTIKPDNKLQYGLEVALGVTMAALLGIEHALGRLEAAKEKAHEAALALKHAAALTKLQTGIDALTVHADLIAAKVTAAAADAAVAAGAAAIAQTAGNRDILCTTYQLTAKTVGLAGDGASLVIGEPAGTSANGHVHLVGLGHVAISSHPGTNTILLQTNAMGPLSNGILIKSNTNVKLSSGDPILPSSAKIDVADKNVKIWTSAAGPKMDLKPTSICLEVGPAPPLPRIDLDTKVTLAVGPSKITLAATGITLECGPTSKIDLTPTRIDVNGLSVASKGELELVTQALRVAEEKILMLESKSTLLKQG